MFALPSAMLLAGASFEHRTSPLRNVTRVFCGLFIIGSVWAVIAREKRTTENWREAANHLRTFTQSGYCIVTIPAGNAEYYEFFDPSLRQFQCRTGQRSPVVIAVDPYSSKQLVSGQVNSLTEAGFYEISDEHLGAFETIALARIAQ